MYHLDGCQTALACGIKLIDRGAGARVIVGQLCPEVEDLDSQRRGGRLGSFGHHLVGDQLHTLSGIITDLRGDEARVVQGIFCH